MQNIMTDVRVNANNQQNGVITVMLRDAAMMASQDPTRLERLGIDFLGNNEVSLKENAIGSKKKI
jgi:hypothetical protein